MSSSNSACGGRNGKPSEPGGRHATLLCPHWLCSTGNQEIKKSVAAGAAELMHVITNPFGAHDAAIGGTPRRLPVSGPASTP
jgi:hypothetical protein